jgi:UDP-N-acetylmuramate dehydrogenase
MNEIRMEKIREILEYCHKESRCEIDIRYEEPMCEHTTFKVGGPADCWLCPRGENFPSFCVSLLSRAKDAKIPVFILGGGANIVVSDKGIRGIVLDMGAWNGITLTEEELIVKSGTTMDETAESASAFELSGLEFLAGMPGTIGGAVYMNARGFGTEISDVLSWTEILDFDEKEPLVKKIITNKEDFGNKCSPFQGKDNLILRACFKLSSGKKESIINLMDKNKKERQDKGHYLFPCAGSAFKNNREFGKPAGLIIDELGLKGFSIGGAQIAPFHGNFVINTGGATAKDIRALVDEVAAKVKTETGFTLELEILFVGEWETMSN